MSGLPASLAFGAPSARISENRKLSGGKHSPGHSAGKSKTRSRVDLESWRAECDRVKDSLVITVPSDLHGEWRADLERAKSTLQSLQSTSDVARTALEDLGQGITSKLEDVGNLENTVNPELQEFRGKVSSLNQQVASLQQECNQRKEIVGELQQELMCLNEEMEIRRLELEEQGERISSNKPVVELNAAIKVLKSEILQMDVQTGVLQHLLLRTW